MSIDILNEGRFKLLDSLAAFFNPVAIKQLDENRYYIKPYSMSELLNPEVDQLLALALKDLSCEIDKQKSNNSGFMEDNDLHPEYIVTINQYTSDTGYLIENYYDLMRRIVAHYFLNKFEKMAYKFIDSGEIYVKPYDSSFSHEEIEATVREDLKNFNLLIETFYMEPYFINDEDDTPEFMITIND